MAQYDILIKGGIVIDGRRTPRFRADIGVIGGKVTRIGNLRGAEADRVIDAEGCIVAPGIIDLHTHYDSQVFWNPYCSPSGWHGVTPYGCPCISDGGAHTKFMTAAHFGIYYLMTYVREHGWVSLEDAHWKLSGLPSLYVGLGNRGTLVEGAPADLFVYDFDRLDITPHEEVADYPAGEWRRIDRPIGIDYVMVNGEVTMDGNTQTNAPAGELIRQKAALVAA